jgi:hypothetical protein
LTTCSTAQHVPEWAGDGFAVLSACATAAATC